MKRIPALALFAVAIALAQPGVPAEAAQDNQHNAEPAGTPVKMHGVVNSINATAGRVNITHDPVAELKWPTMKMNFKVQDPSTLNGLESGMTVDFEIQKMGSQYLVTRITPVN